jgi:ATP-binding cassette subfamily F protein uup
VVGANGAGKTTLLKLLTGEIEPDEGIVKRAKTLDGVIIDQQRKLMDPTKSVRDILADGGDWVDVRGVRKHVQGYLKDFLFEPGLIDAKIGTLSGGERSRLLLAREFARRSNLLVLDEPTNDLDLETLDLLQEVIADYEGTVPDRQPRSRLPRPHRHDHAWPRRLRQGGCGGRRL